MRTILTFLALSLLSTLSLAADGNRLAYLDEPLNPYYPHRSFPKLITPQWVGEEGVDCVVTLAIDDMRDPAKYEAFLRPILDRLKKIDGRVPVSIMTCQVKPDDPQLQTWLKEGLSIECHTFDHPCPCLKDGTLKTAKETYDKCVDLISQIPNNKPVAFRMPCCDSLNTPSPRFWAEVMHKTTPAGNFLQIDSSVFNLITPLDKELPDEITLLPSGEERFRRYIPFKNFVNTIEDYPYPYVIGRMCWEFPCVVPSDWSAQHVQKPNNPDTVRDLKLALDAVVLKKGVYNLVFHPHGWIRSEQIVDLIDHAVTKHGKKVKFLTFKECAERLRANLQDDETIGPWWDEKGFRLLDVDNDGFMDVITHSSGIAFGRPDESNKFRLWLAKERTWKDYPFPTGLVTRVAHNSSDLGAKFGISRRNGFASFLINHSMGVTKDADSGIWEFTENGWARTRPIDMQIQEGIPEYAEGTLLVDLDNDGTCEAIVGPSRIRGKANRSKGAPSAVFQYSTVEGDWTRLPFRLPSESELIGPKEFTGPQFPHSPARIVDVNGDGLKDLLFSNSERYCLYLFKDKKEGWATKVFDEVRGKETGTAPVIPSFVRADGTNNGAFFHSGALCVINEDTNRLPNHVQIITFAEMLKSGVGFQPAQKKKGMQHLKMKRLGQARCLPHFLPPKLSPPSPFVPA